MQSIFANQLIVQELSDDDRIYDRAVATILGGAIADSMGWITEFVKTKATLKKYTGSVWLDRYVSWQKKTGGRFNTYIDHISAGDYSDDTQLALCLARSIDANGELNARYFMKVELPLWMQYARGAGRTITAAAKAASRKSATWNANFFSYKYGKNVVDYRDSGANGAAMRVAPLAIANVQSADDEFQLQLWKNAIITHGHPRAIIGSLVIAECLRRVLREDGLAAPRFFDDLTKWVRELRLPQDHHVRSWVNKWNSVGRDFEALFKITKREMVEALIIASESRDRPVPEIAKDLGCYAPSTRGSGLATTAVALALFYRYGGNYEKCIEQAVNMLGTDTDTIAAMAGALTGAYCGTSAFPESWGFKVQDFNYFHRVGEALARIGTKRAKGWDLGPQPDTSNAHILNLSDIENYAKDQRVSHPIFGLGSIRSVHSQEIRRRGGGMITLVDIDFDMGQSIRLRSRPRLLHADDIQVEIARSRDVAIEVSSL